MTVTTAPRTDWLAAHQEILRRKTLAAPVEGHAEHAHAITDLLVAYAVHYDAGDLDSMIELFEPDATYESLLGRCEGHDALRANFAPLIARYARTAHLVVNSTVHVTSSTAADAVSYLHALVQTRDGIAYGLCGSYQDQVTRRSGTWRIARRFVADGLAYRTEQIEPADRLPPAPTQ
ncbi:nuclear transport factor 2 family protein [Saccharopolyspora sp. ASAGF58]|uniref:nuclear transport factor 2 family protein n=1 Tax=Saccharopolyspora sp. ASAGF58 TaxID=2719023 RepID=UPI0014452DD4|nr:nuclear transport factor 2 family protein [Saccharopolyspora sp. ASAGF58]